MILSNSKPTSGLLGLFLASLSLTSLILELITLVKSLLLAGEIKEDREKGGLPGALILMAILPIPLKLNLYS
jgi:hypothetical protein